MYLCSDRQYVPVFRLTIFQKLIKRSHHIGIIKCIMKINLITGRCSDEWGTRPFKNKSGSHSYPQSKILNLQPSVFYIKKVLIFIRTIMLSIHLSWCFHPDILRKKARGRGMLAVKAMWSIDINWVGFKIFMFNENTLSPQWEV